MRIEKRVNNGLRRGPITSDQRDHAVVDKHTVTCAIRCVPVGCTRTSPIPGIASIKLTASVRYSMCVKARSNGDDAREVLHVLTMPLARTW